MSVDGRTGTSGSPASATGPATAFAAVDLGATSGRVMLGILEDGHLALHAAHRFGHELVRREGVLCWDRELLWHEIRTGLRAAGHAARERGLDGIAAIGIDSWAVDYGLVGPDGRLLGELISYRDARTDGAADRVARQVDPSRQYAITGIAQLPFTTIYQLAVDDRLDDLPTGTTALLLPDLIAFWLTGRRRTELTNASTTGLLDAAGHRFHPELLAAAGVDADLFAPFISPGEQLGPLTPELAAELDLGEVPVVAVGSHDTASAVLAVPAAEGAAPVAYVSSGTWSLVGLELEAPVTSQGARQAGFTNEGGVGGTTRFLKNVMGMWLLTESRRQWAEEDGIHFATTDDLDELLSAAAREEPGRFRVDATDPAFSAPGRMADRITAAAHDTTGAGTAPTRRPQIVRCILDSLARAYGEALHQACELAGVPRPEVLHLVGGGSRNDLLNRLTAEETGCRVVAGPVEATALGNLAVLAQAAGLIPAGTAAVRDLVRTSTDVQEIDPV